MEYYDKLAKMPGYTAYIDESGSFGYDFDKPNVLQHYIVCAIIVKNEHISIIEHEIETISRLYFSGNELKSSTIGNNHERRRQILSRLLPLDFSIILLDANKKEFISGSGIQEYKESFIKYLHKLLYNVMYPCFPKLKIIEDEYGSSEFQHGYREYIKRHRPKANLLNEYDFDYVNSKDSYIVQIADIIAGSYMQRINDSKAPNINMLFKGKLRDIIQFPFKQFPYKDNSSNKDFNDNIYILGYKKANEFIYQNEKIKDEDTRIKILFLKYLLFKVHIYDYSQYVHAYEIKQHLNTVTDKKITNDYIRRKIIAPLRDEGVIIASSQSGYKLPTCEKDIEKYLKQTISIVGPMLSRIGICRKLFLTNTEGNYDILNNSEYNSLRRYFGDY